MSEVQLTQPVTAVLREMQEAMSGEIESIQAQTAQIESLLKDAIASLHESFDAIHGASSQQMKTMTALMMDVTGASDDENIFQKAENSSTILTNLIDTMLLSSKNNLQALTTMDVIKKRLQMMVEMDREEDDLIAQLSKCAAAEDFNIEQVRQFIKQSQEMQQKQTDYTADTVRKFKATHHVIDTVASRDLDEVFAAKAKVEEILKHFFQINEVVTKSRVAVNQENADMRQHLGSAIRALQFEDISTQSLGHTDRHLGRMSGMIEILTKGIKELDQTDIGIEEYTRKISDIHLAMMEYHRTLQLENSNPVSQESMDEGDIDLF